jgi:hypothetical protein
LVLSSVASWYEPFVIEADVLAHVLLHELAGGQEVVLVVLLEDLQPGRIGQGLEVNRCRVDLRRNVGEADIEHARVETGLAGVLHETEVAVIDGDHQVLLVVARDGLRGRRHKLGTPERHHKSQSYQPLGHGSILPLCARYWALLEG